MPDADGVRKSVPGDASGGKNFFKKREKKLAIGPVLPVLGAKRAPACPFFSGHTQFTHTLARALSLRPLQKLGAFGAVSEESEKTLEAGVWNPDAFPKESEELGNKKNLIRIKMQKYHPADSMTDSCLSSKRGKRP